MYISSIKTNEINCKGKLKANSQRPKLRRKKSRHVVNANKSPLQGVAKPPVEKTNIEKIQDFSEKHLMEISTTATPLFSWYINACGLGTAETVYGARENFYDNVDSMAISMHNSSVG